MSIVRELLWDYVGFWIRHVDVRHWWLVVHGFSRMGGAKVAFCVLLINMYMHNNPITGV